jgi:type IV secretion system protein TrbE
MSLHPIDDSLAALIPYGSITPLGVNMRGRGLLVGYEAHGPSNEGTSKAEVANRASLYAAALSHLGSGDIVTAIINRLPAWDYPHRRFSNEAAQLLDRERRQHFERQDYWQTFASVWIANAFESAFKSRIDARLFSSADDVPTIELQARHFGERILTVEDSLSAALGLQRLPPIETFRNLNLAITGKYLPLALPPPHMRLNEVLANERWYGGTHPWIGELHQRPVCITAFPNETFPQMLAVLLRHPGQMTISARFICQDPYHTAEQLGLERHFWERVQLGTLIDMLAKACRIDRAKTLHQDADAQVEEIDGAIAAAAAGLAFGWLTITALIWDTDPDRASMRARDLVKDLAALGLIARLEDANAVEAIMGTWPGNAWNNIRRPMMTAANFAEMVLPVEHWKGTPTIESPFFPADTPVPVISGGSGREPFYLPTHLSGVSNQLVIGPTGSGKSSYLAVLASAITGIANARVVWLDLDYSSFVISHAIGATYQELATDGSSPLCPFIYLDDADGTGWLFEWFRRLFKRWEITLTERETTDLTEALRLAKQLGVRTMTLFARLIQTQRLREVLANYTTGNKWGFVFDGSPDNSAALGGAVTVFEMRPLSALGPAAEAPATELILHAVERTMGTDPVWIIVDEGWRLLSDEVSSAWLWEAIRTFRKRNSGITLATQSLTEVAESKYRNLLLESCPGKIFLPNNDIAGEYVHESYRKLGLSEREIAIIGAAIPQRQYFFHSARGKRLFQLDLGRMAMALCASTGSTDVDLARQLLKANGPKRFLHAWLRAKGLEPALQDEHVLTSLISPSVNGRNGVDATQTIA